MSNAIIFILFIILILIICFIIVQCMPFDCIRSPISPEAFQGRRCMSGGSQMSLHRNFYSEGSQSDNVMGFVILNKQNYLHIAIAKEYQNRGIATAIIAQLIEIYFSRHIINEHFIIYIKSVSKCLYE